MTQFLFTIGKWLFWFSLLSKDYYPMMDAIFSISLLLIMIHVTVKFVADPFLDKLVSLLKIIGLLYALQYFDAFPF